MLGDSAATKVVSRQDFHLSTLAFRERKYTHTVSEERKIIEREREKERVSEGNNETLDQFSQENQHGLVGCFLV